MEIRRLQREELGEAARVVRMILAAYRSGGQEVETGGEII